MGVIVAGRDGARLAAARAEGLEAIRADLSDAEGCDTLAAAVADRPLDLLVKNARVESHYVVGESIDLDAADRSIRLNLNAPIRLIGLLLGGLRARPEAMIVNVTSGLAIAPRASSPVYCATKAGLRSFTQALRAQLAGSRVHVMEALPPVVETRMTQANRHKKMSAAECARRIVAAMAAGKREARVGQVALLSRVYTLSPPLARRIMLRYRCAPVEPVSSPNRCSFRAKSRNARARTTFGGPVSPALLDLGCPRDR